MTREDLIALLNEDQAGEYQAVISYVVYSQVLQGSQYTSITDPLESHVAEVVTHASLIDDLDATTDNSNQLLCLPADVGNAHLSWGVRP